MTKRDALLEALAEARHEDPFSVLGPHVEAGGLVIRACVPTAERISITRNGSPALPMKRRHAAGIFEAVVPRVKEIQEYASR